MCMHLKIKKLSLKFKVNVDNNLLCYLRQNKIQLSYTKNYENTLFFTNE